MTAARSTYVLSLPSTSWMPKPGLAGGVTALINGSMMPFVKAVTIVVNAAPMTTATARSTTLPRRMKSLKPLSTQPPRQRVRPADGIDDPDHRRWSAQGNGDLFGQRRGRHPRRLRARQGD